jgi:hypothetical protein
LDIIMPRLSETGRMIRRFRDCVGAWEAGCRRNPSSRIDELCKDPHYREIVRMGTRAVPLILAEMEARPDHWDLALREITGEDPVPRRSWGKLGEIARAWIEWGRERRLI